MRAGDDERASEAAQGGHKQMKSFINQISQARRKISLINFRL